MKNVIVNISWLGVDRVIKALTPTYSEMQAIKHFIVMEDALNGSCLCDYELLRVAFQVI